MFFTDGRLSRFRLALAAALGGEVDCRVRGVGRAREEESLVPAALQALRETVFERLSFPKSFDARPAILNIEIKKTVLRTAGKATLQLYLTLRYGDGAKPKVSEILATCLGFSPEDCLRIQVRKIGIRRKAGDSRALKNVV